MKYLKRCEIATTVLIELKALDAAFIKTCGVFFLMWC